MNLGDVERDPPLGAGAVERGEVGVFGEPDPERPAVPFPFPVQDDGLRGVDDADQSVEFRRPLHPEQRLPIDLVDGSDLVDGGGLTERRFDGVAVVGRNPEVGDRGPADGDHRLEPDANVAPHRQNATQPDDVGRHREPGDDAHPSTGAVVGFGSGRPERTNGQPRYSGGATMGDRVTEGCILLWRW